MIGSDVPLIYRHGRRLALAAPVSAIVWLGDQACLALGDGTVCVVAPEGELRTIEAHSGAILCATRHPEGRAVLSGGDDGRLMRVDPSGDRIELGRVERRWVEHVVASSGSGIIVAGAGKEAIVWKAGATQPSHCFSFASTIGGLALDAKGKKLAVAHYGGASLLYPAGASSGRIALGWDGSHIACTMHPAGDYLVTGVQETGLHGWKLPMAADMQMTGYKAKTRSFSWSRRAKWLATSGDMKVVIWPFEGKTGPMGKSPLLVGDRDALVTRVAYHPQHDMLAVGYSDGAVALVRTEDDAQSLVEEAPGGPITALAWNDAGTALAFGDEDGRAGLLDMTRRG